MRSGTDYVRSHTSHSVHPRDGSHHSLHSPSISSVSPSPPWGCLDTVGRPARSRWRTRHRPHAKTQQRIRTALYIYRIANAKRKKNNDDDQKMMAVIAARSDAMRFESEMRCGVRACELISLILAHIRYRGFCAYFVTVVGGGLKHDADNTDRSRMIVEVTSDIHQS
jgi:hypothetical protein